MINTLQTGADNLILADQNQESANLLTLQTRQQLEVSALSIANQANQSVLKLFG
jgi:flagellin-like hook-associated protein FlgL